MNREDMLAGLIAQAALDGGDLVTLRAIVEEASEVGAGRALARLGLSDEAAQDDLDELRELLGAWRAAKASAMSRAAAAFNSAKSISAGERARLCHLSPPSSTIGRPALALPW